MDYYAVLGLERGASLDDIKAAYRKKAFESHPDRNPGDKTASERFKQVQEAYDNLNDPVKKAKIDGTRSHRTSSANSTYKPFEGMWDSVFGKAPPEQERGRNIQITIELNLFEVLNGVEKKTSVPRMERCNKCDSNGFTEYKPCPACHGSGKTTIKQLPFNNWMSCLACRGSGRAGSISCDACKGDGCVACGTVELGVTIPPGVETGHQVRVPNYGAPSKHINGKNGDLNIIIIVKEHKVFKRQGVNLSYEFPIGFAEMCLGATVEVPTMTGSTAVNIPPNTKDFTQIRLKGLGLPYLHGGKGDLIIILKLMNPSSDIINSNKEIFEKFGEFEKNHLTAERDKLK